ncbi:MAG: ArsA-related P-loop ATPase [Myxococcota bacterium]
MSQLERLLEAKSTLVVVGPGGVGKTTTAAALAVRGARMGKKVLVLTIDPARRLANSLGLEGLGNEEVRVAPQLFAEAGISLGSGALFAMMLDVKSTFDTLIERHARSPEARDRILQNRYYQQASTALAGSQEYMAMEKLYEVLEERDYDLVVLDTPPMVNAVEFLSAPDRLEGFLESGSLRVLLAGVRTAGRFGMGFMKLNSRILSVMNRFIGTETFLSLLEFIESFQDMFDGFQQRASRVRGLFTSPELAFAVVTSTDRSALDEGLAFHRRLRADGMPFGALIVNRVRPSDLATGRHGELAERIAAVAAGAPAMALHDTARVARLARRVAEANARYDVLAQVDVQRLDEARAALGEDADHLWPVPLFARDIHDIAGLAEFADLVG